MRAKLLSIALAVLPFFGLSHGDGEPIKDAKSFGETYYHWHMSDPKKDKKMGVSVWRTYDKLIKGRSAKTKIIVAVIDGGIDHEHEDLKNVMWVNEDEIAENGIDDDKNGYIDDIHGWNFLGNASGKNVNEENLEYTRIYKRLSPKYKGKSESDIAKADHEEFLLYKEVAGKVEENRQKYQIQLTQIEQLLARIEQIDAVVNKEMGKKDYSLEELKKVDSDDPAVTQMVGAKIMMIEQGITRSRLERGMEHYKTYLDYYLNADYNGRADIIGDDPSDYTDRGYGNPDIKGPDSFHGTFVAGLIGAERGNGMGIDGIANNVEIMGLRAIPNGDEYDKDVALAIRYAVDNGAKIINMSFGKMYSPYKFMVDDAIKYAESKGVLLVNAAGNDHTNIDEEPHYPVDYFEGGQVNNMITVGASSFKMNDSLTGSFSNYGRQHVDVFAPGVDIVSCAPESTYEKANGTSFASPVTAGVAALVWSYYPKLTAEEMKEVILQSTYIKKLDEVNLPKGRGAEAELTAFNSICVTGGVVNTFSAMKLAKKMSRKKK